MAKDEINSMAIEDVFLFFISNYSLIDSHFNKEKIKDYNFKIYLKNAYDTGIQEIKTWILTH